jgi:hypothetical protein
MKPFEDLTDSEMAELEATDWTSEQIVTAIGMALDELNMEAVVALLHRLALKDPSKAALILAMIEVRS